MSIPQQTAPIYQHPVVDFNWIADGWRGFLQRPWPWVGATFIACAILALIYFGAMIPVFYIGLHPNNMRASTAAPSISQMLGIYAVWFLVIFVLMMASFVFVGGMFRMAYRQLQGEEAGVLDFFSVGDSLGALMCLGLLHAAMSVVGSIGCGIPTIVGHGLFMFAPLIVVVKRVSAVDACRQSFALLRDQWFMAAVFMLVLWLLISFGGMLLGIGTLVAGPVAVMAITAGYYRLGGRIAPKMPLFESAPPDVWPPPPTQVAGGVSGGQQPARSWAYPPPPGGSGHLPPNPYGYNGSGAVAQNAANTDEVIEPVIPAASASKENEDADGSSHESV